MGMHNNMTTTLDNDYGVDVRRYSDSASSMEDCVSFPGPVQPLQKQAITDWIEMWDYVGGIRFRGFVAEKDNEKAMFIFFDQSVMEGDLKAGYVFAVILFEDAN